MQPTFGDAEQKGRRKRTRREIVLPEMEHTVPRWALFALIAPHCWKAAARVGSRIDGKRSYASSYCRYRDLECVRRLEHENQRDRADCSDLT